MGAPHMGGESYIAIRNRSMHSTIRYLLGSLFQDSLLSSKEVSGIISRIDELPGLHCFDDNLYFYDETAFEFSKEA